MYTGTYFAHLYRQPGNDIAEQMQRNENVVRSVDMLMKSRFRYKAFDRRGRLVAHFNDVATSCSMARRGYRTTPAWLVVLDGGKCGRGQAEA